MAATMVATQADAQTIVYEDIDDVTIEIGDIVLVDVNGDGYDDFLFQATFLPVVYGHLVVCSVTYLLTQ